MAPLLPSPPLTCSPATATAGAIGPRQRARSHPPLVCTLLQAQVQAWLRASNGEQQAPPRQVQRMVKRSLQAMEGCLREGNLPWQAIDQVCSGPVVSAL